MAADKSHGKDWRGFRSVHSARPSHREWRRLCPAYLLPPKPFAGLTKCLFPRNTEVLKQVMVIASGDLLKRAALARARHPTGLTIARIKITSRLICTRQ